MRPAIYALILQALFLVSSLGFEKEVRPILERSCVKCHGGEKVKGEVDFSKILTEADVDTQFELWETVAEVIEAGEMPPEDEPQLSEADKRIILGWYKKRLGAPVESRPGVFRPRRLSAREYRNTLHSLFGFELKVAIAPAEQTVQGEQSLVMKLLPTDPPGESGFVNDTHGARISTAIWDRYSQVSNAALEIFFSAEGRDQLIDYIGESVEEKWTAADLTSGQASILVLKFASRAVRREADRRDVAKIIERLEGKEGEELLAATKFELRAILMSPGFLYRGILMEGEPGKQQAVDGFELAERLSYFLWEDSPDEELYKLAAKGELSDPEIVRAQVDRMLASPKARSLAESFGAQWLLLDNLDELLKKDPIRHHALKSQPLDFLDYLFTEDRPVMEIIDSRITFVNQGTSGFYGKDRTKMERYTKPKGIERTRTPNQRLVLEHAEGRGGILTMPGILTMNIGPIQRGTWMLRQILGEQLGEPPADIPPIKPSPRGQNLTFRERFEQHRSDTSCARCHEKIDPLGFALDAYDKNGQFTLASDRRKAKNPPKPADTSGKLPSGEAFSDFAELKSILMTSQREVVVRNIVERTLAYALCRKLVRSDQPTVDEITENLCENDGTWESLFVQIANSLPFRETIFETSKENHE